MTSLCLFVSDLHGRKDLYARLFRAIEDERPLAVFLGGDLLPFGHALPEPSRATPSGPDGAGSSDLDGAVPSAPNGAARSEASGPAHEGFLRGWFMPRLEALRGDLGESWPRLFVIPGNDDPRREEPIFLEGEERGLWTWAQGRIVVWGDRLVLGYGCVPPTPFLNKDWERYDVSRYVDPGCVSPEEGWRSVAVDPHETKWGTIRNDLERIVQQARIAMRPGSVEPGGEGTDPSRAAPLVCLFHAPPYGTALDRAALDGTLVDHAPVDVHVGSIAIRRFIETVRPVVTMHGHIHESARLTGAWRDRIGSTVCLSAAHDGPGLALVRFDADDPGRAKRTIL